MPDGNEEFTDIPNRGQDVIPTASEYASSLKAHISNEYEQMFQVQKKKKKNRAARETHTANRFSSE